MKSIIGFIKTHRRFYLSLLAATVIIAAGLLALNWYASAADSNKTCKINSDCPAGEYCKMYTDTIFACAEIGGTVGASCTSQAGCAEGLYCAVYATPITCQNKLLAEYVCSYKQQCQSNICDDKMTPFACACTLNVHCSSKICDRSTGHCSTVGLSAGKTCEPDYLSADCQEGLFCDPATKRCIAKVSGGACTTNDQCSAGQICYSQTYRCEAPKGAGAVCVTYDECQAGYTCIAAAGAVKYCTLQPCSSTNPCPNANQYCKQGSSGLYSCVNKVEYGKDCPDGNAQCLSGFCDAGFCHCKIDDDCESGKFCSANLCANKSGVGSSCSDDSKCLEGLYCDKTKTPASCQPKKGSYDTDSPCTDNIQCRNNICVAYDGQNYCGCNVDADCVQTSLKHFCISNLCRSQSSEGGICYDDKQCTDSNNCIKAADAKIGTCAAKIEGNACTQNKNCQSMFYCSAKQCVKKNATGAACKKDFECLSNKCSKGKCAPSELNQGCWADSDCKFPSIHYCKIVEKTKTSEDSAGTKITTVYPENVCTMKIRNEVTCNQDEPAACMSGTCAATAEGANVCASSDEGKGCLESMDCKIDLAFSLYGKLYCDKNTFVCANRKGGNQECKANEECLTNECKFAKPKAKSGLCTGSTCASASDCLGNEYCDTGYDKSTDTCLSKLLGGAECKESLAGADCLSKECVKDSKGKFKCTEAVGEKETPTSAKVAGAKKSEINIAGLIGEKLAMFKGLGMIKYDVQSVLGIIIKTILGLTGSVALVMFVYGGISWMTAGGSSERVKKSRDIFVWSAMGLIVIFGAYAIVNYIIRSL